MDTKPYTYLIGWSNLNLWYYGVKYSKGCHPDQFWNSYFTSSKYVKQTRKEFGEPDVIQIRKVFEDSKKARSWENKVLKRMGVVKDSRWLNKTDNKSISPECCAHGKTKGYKHTEEAKQLMSEAWKNREPISEETREKLIATSYGRLHSEETKELLRQLNLGKKMSEESIEKIRQARIGTKASEEARANMSKSATGRKMSEEAIEKTAASHRGKPKPSEKIKEHAKSLQRPVACPHCNKIGSYANMKRWHFDNCSNKVSDGLFELFE